MIANSNSALYNQTWKLFESVGLAWPQQGDLTVEPGFDSFSLWNIWQSRIDDDNFTSQAGELEDAVTNSNAWTEMISQVKGKKKYSKK